MTRTSGSLSRPPRDAGVAGRQLSADVRWAAGQAPVHASDLSRGTSTSCRLATTCRRADGSSRTPATPGTATTEVLQEQRHGDVDPGTDDGGLRRRRTPRPGDRRARARRIVHSGSVSTSRPSMSHRTACTLTGPAVDARAARAPGWTRVEVGEHEPVAGQDLATASRPDTRRAARHSSALSASQHCARRSSHWPRFDPHSDQGRGSSSRSLTRSPGRTAVRDCGTCRLWRRPAHRGGPSPCLGRPTAGRTASSMPQRRPARTALRGEDPTWRPTAGCRPSPRGRWRCRRRRRSRPGACSWPRPRTARASAVRRCRSAVRCAA